MLSDVQVWFVIFAVSLIALGLQIAGVATGAKPDLRAVADKLPYVMLVAALFERYLWRIEWLHPHVVGRPIVRGTWKGTLSPVAYAGGTITAPKPAYLAIDQTLLTVRLRLFTDESSSDQVAGTVVKQPGGEWTISTTYVNTPRMSRRDSSPIHYGGVLLNILGEPPTRLDGEYWTSRQSRGELVFDVHVDKIARSYEDARTAFGAQTGDSRVGPLTPD